MTKKNTTRTKRRLTPIIMIEVDEKDDKKCNKICPYISIIEHEIKCNLFQEFLLHKTKTNILHEFSYYILRCPECLANEV